MAAIKEHGVTGWKIVVREGIPTALVVSSTADESANKHVRKCYLGPTGLPMAELDPDIQDAVNEVWDGHKGAIEDALGAVYTSREDYLEIDPFSCVDHPNGAAAAATAEVLVWTRDIRYPDGSADRAVKDKPIEIVPSTKSALIKLYQHAIDSAEVRYNSAVSQANEHFGGVLPE